MLPELKSAGALPSRSELFAGTTFTTSFVYLMDTIGMFAAALEVLGSVYWNVCKVGAGTSRLLAFNFTVLRLQEIVIFEVMITETFS